MSLYIYIDRVSNSDKLPQDPEFSARPALTMILNHDNGTEHWIALGRNSGRKWDVAIDTEAYEFLTAQLASRDIVGRLEENTSIAAESASSDQVYVNHNVKDPLKALRRVSINDLDDESLKKVLGFLYQPLKMTPEQMLIIQDEVCYYSAGIRNAEKLADNSNNVGKRLMQNIKSFFMGASAPPIYMGRETAKATLHYVAHLEREEGHPIPMP